MVWDGDHAIIEGSAPHIDPQLQIPLTLPAKRQGTSLPEFAQNVFRSRADLAERSLIEQTDDEPSRQRYIETGAAVPFATLHERLRVASATDALRIREAQ